MGFGEQRSTHVATQQQSRTASSSTDSAANWGNQDRRCEAMSVNVMEPEAHKYLTAHSRMGPRSGCCRHGQQHVHVPASRRTRFGCGDVHFRNITDVNHGNAWASRAQGNPHVSSTIRRPRHWLSCVSYPCLVVSAMPPSLASQPSWSSPTVCALLQIPGGRAQSPAVGGW